MQTATSYEPGIVRKGKILAIIKKKKYLKYISRGPKLEGCALANFGNSSLTEGEPSQKSEKNGGKKKKNQCCRDRESNPGPVDN